MQKHSIRLAQILMRDEDKNCFKYAEQTQVRPGHRGSTLQISNFARK